MESFKVSEETVKELLAAREVARRLLGIPRNPFLKCPKCDKQTNYPIGTDLSLIVCWHCENARAEVRSDGEQP